MKPKIMIFYFLILFSWCGFMVGKYYQKYKPSDTWIEPLDIDSVGRYSLKWRIGYGDENHDTVTATCLDGKKVVAEAYLYSRVKLRK